jgi:hypothetical protein
MAHERITRRHPNFHTGIESIAQHHGENAGPAREVQSPHNRQGRSCTTRNRTEQTLSAPATRRGTLARVASSGATAARLTAWRSVRFNRREGATTTVSNSCIALARRRRQPPVSSPKISRVCTSFRARPAAIISEANELMMISGRLLGRVEAGQSRPTRRARRSATSVADEVAELADGSPSGTGRRPVNRSLHIHSRDVESYPVSIAVNHRRAASERPPPPRPLDALQRGISQVGLRPLRGHGNVVPGAYERVVGVGSNDTVTAARGPYTDELSVRARALRRAA